METKDSVVSVLSQPEIYKALNPFRLLKQVSMARMVAPFPQTCWSLPAATDLGEPCVCAVPECCPKSSAIDFAVKTFSYLLE